VYCSGAGLPAWHHDPAGPPNAMKASTTGLGPVDPDRRKSPHRATTYSQHVAEGLQPCAAGSGTAAARARPAVLALIALLGLAGCARQQAKPQGQRIALLRFENLGQDTSADWIGRAIPVVLEAELSGVPDVTVIGTSQLHAFDRTLGVRPVSAPGVSAERQQALAAGANRLAYGDYSVRGGRLYARLWLEDPQTQAIVKVAEASTAADDAIGAASALARQLAAHLSPYSTRSEATIRAYVQGLEGKDIAQAASRMEEAIAADPDFGPAYRSLSELDLQRKDRDGALAVLHRALARGGIAPLDRARIQLDAANIENDLPAKQQALAALTKVEPRSARTWQSLADVAMARHDYMAALDGYRHALDIEPENANLLNQLGYAATYAGRFDEGMAALAKYRKLRPKDANALDSMGDLNLLTNRYGEAEDFYLQAHKLDPNLNANSSLFKAAMARAMTGDPAGAEDLYKQYIVARTKGNDSNAPFKHAEWLWLVGRRKEALAELLAFARTAEARNDRPTASRAYAGIAMWHLMDNDRPAAQEMAQKAIALADKSSAAGAVIARFLAQPSASAEEWETRADHFVPNGAESTLKNQMLAWALLLDRQFKAAKVPLQRLYDASGSASNEGLPVLLAWSDVETGDFTAAAPLLARTPVPPATGISTFMPLWFPRIFELRAAVAEKAGNADEAKKERELFGKLSGR
jgi:tetratricopeptide (TPR) repeat protein